MNTYYITQTLQMPLDDAVEKVTATLYEEGFNILTDANIQTAIDKELGIEIIPYRILGFLNPHFAYQAVQLDRHIGPMIPCTVVVQELGPNLSEVTAMNPAIAMDIVENEALQDLANDVTRCLKRGLDRAAQSRLSSTPDLHLRMEAGYS